MYQETLEEQLEKLKEYQRKNDMEPTDFIRVSDAIQETACRLASYREAHPEINIVLNGEILYPKGAKA